MMAMYEVRRPAVLLIGAILVAVWEFRPETVAFVPAWTVGSLALFAALVTAARVALAWREAGVVKLEGRRRVAACGAAVAAAGVVVAVSWLEAGSGGLFNPVVDSRVEHAFNATVLLLFASVVLAMCMWLGRLSRGCVAIIAASALGCFAIAAFNLFPAEWAWDAAALVGLGGTALTASLGLGWMIDPNPISLHGFYRERIVRAYLGASNPHRGKKNVEVTDAVHGDDLGLACAYDPARGGPYPILNTT
jgi:hypothetical protein